MEFGTPRLMYFAANPAVLALAADDLVVISDPFVQEIEKLGPGWEDALVALFGHEMAHLIFPANQDCDRHSGWQYPLKLVCLADRRANEMRADRLGARLACQAGANLNRIVTFWALREEGTTVFDEWRTTHPLPLFRSHRLKKELRECTARQSKGRHHEPLTSLDVDAAAW